MNDYSLVFQEELKEMEEIKEKINVEHQLNIKGRVWWENYAANEQLLSLDAIK